MRMALEPFYGVSQFETNVFASAQTFSGQIVATDPGNTVPVCRGQAISVTVSVANNGTGAINNAGFRVFLNNGPNSYTGGWDMWTGTTTSPAGTWFTQTLNMQVPFVSPGLYWILWTTDTGNAFAEWNEDDNSVHSAMSLNVQGC